METIRRYFNISEGELARSVLQGAGINAVLVDRHTCTLGPGYAPGGVRLQVPAEEVERALEILDGKGETVSLNHDFEPDDQSAKPDQLAEEELTSSKKALIGIGFVLMIGLVVLSFLSVIWSRHCFVELFKLGNAEYRQKNYSGAIRYYDAALVKRPHSYTALYNRGLAYFEKKDYESAVDSFSKASSLNPEYQNSAVMRIWALEYLRRHRQALEQVEIFLRENKNRDNYDLCSLRGILQWKVGNTQMAVNELSDLIKLAPGKARAYIDLAWIYATAPQSQLRDGLKALQLVRQADALSTCRKDYVFFFTWASAEAESGDFDAAVRYQRQSLLMAKSDDRVDGWTLKEMKDALADFQHQKPYRDTD